MAWWPAARSYLAGIVLALLAVGSVLLLRGRGEHETLIAIQQPTDGQVVTVFVGGAVAQPGVYTLPRGERVDAAIVAAGGFASDADPDAINRALRLRDEAQIIVPRKGEPRAAPTSQAPGTRPAGTATAAPGGATRQATVVGQAGRKLNVNTATASELEQLPGIGPHLAQQIVDYRTANGDFKTPADLAKVKGISERMVADWAELITFGP